MNFSCPKKLLEEGVQAVRNAVATRSNLPILSNILMEANQDNSLRLVGTDLEIGIEKRIEVEVKEEGAVTVPAKLFAEFLNICPEVEINIELEKKKNRISLILGKSLYRLNTLSAEEFPHLPETSGYQIEMQVEIFKDMIKKTVFAAAPPTESRVTLTGVLISLEDKRLNLVATNAHRLAIKEVSLGKSGKKGIEKRDLIVPARALQELNRILQVKDKEKDVLEMTIGENQIKFKFKDIILYSRTIEGQFPPYQQVIPEKFEKEWKINTQEFLRAIKAASIVAKEDTNIVKLRAEKSSLTISSSAQDVGEVKEVLEIEQSGENLEITFNVEYILDVLPYIETDYTILQLTREVSPGLIKPEGDERYLYILMPVRTS